MTTVAVMPVTSTHSETIYHAVAGDKQASGNTIGEAIDALTPQLEDDDNATTLILVQKQGSDRFFTAAQQQRKQELLAQWRAAQDMNTEISDEAQAELEALVLQEIRAAGQRAAALLQGSTK